MENGVVLNFEKERGFGFIRAIGYSKDVFVHVSDVVGGEQLHEGQKVRFEITIDDRGPRAIRVEPGRRGLSPRFSSLLSLTTVLAALMGILFVAKVPLVWAWLGAINPVAFAVYGWDKHLAGSARRRVPEAVLLGLAMIGGSPGAFLAMRWYRHKTRKITFLIPFGLIVVSQVAALGWWFAPGS